MDYLMPCPFCGSAAQKMGSLVLCTGIQCPLHNYGLEVAKWNSRNRGESTVFFRDPVELEFAGNETIATVRVILPDRPEGWNAQSIRDFIRGR